MDNKEFKNLIDELESESVNLLNISATFGALEIAQSEGSSELPQHALYIPTVTLKQTAKRINSLICDMQTKSKKLQSTDNIKYFGGVDKINFPKTFLEGNPDNYIVMNICGNAFAPYYLDGDKLVISCDLTKPNPSNVFLVEIEDKNELRRVYEANEELTVLESLNVNIPPIHAKPEDFKIIGFPYMLIRNINGGMPQ